MKKILLPAMLLMLMAFAACNKESYYHTASITRPLPVGLVYADQDIDTMEFYTTDNFTITTSQSWATIPDTIQSGKIPNIYRMIWTVVAPVVFEPNTTGDIRTVYVYVNINADDNWNWTASTAFRQVSWLEISRPAPNYSYKDRVITGVAFECKDSAHFVTDTLEFYTNGPWTLSVPTSSFARPESTSGSAGQNKIPVTLDPNDGLADRDVTVSLTSRGVTTPIKFTQFGKKEEE